MTNDTPPPRDPQDRTRIDVRADHEVGYWTRVMGCTPEELREAVEAVGVSADAVRRYLEVR